MSKAEFEHLRMSMDGDVALAEVLMKDIRTPDEAQELGAELDRVVAQPWAAKLLINVHRMRYLCSTGFGVFFRIGHDMKKAGKQVKMCELKDDLKVGADIIGLGKMVALYDTEQEALDAFRTP